MFLEFLVSFRDLKKKKIGGGGEEGAQQNMCGSLPLQSLHNNNFIPVLVSFYRAKIGSLN